ncbi:MAG TPA: DUF559 domain-containing protein [Acetobacteraceae bacterium]|nr:DUF559 domain-containing protein [Acetobacteraceae bacterium]
MQPRQELEGARIARRFPTATEKRLWSRLRRDALGCHFRRQHPVPPYVLDFGCPSLKIAVEADGGQHNQPGEHAARDRYLQERGWLVLRFWNNEMLENIDGVIAVIHKACQQRAATPLPNPPPLRGGGGAEGQLNFRVVNPPVGISSLKQRW